MERQARSVQQVAAGRGDHPFPFPDTPAPRLSRSPLAFFSSFRASGTLPRGWEVREKPSHVPESQELDAGTRAEVTARKRATHPAETPIVNLNPQTKSSPAFPKRPTSAPPHLSQAASILCSSAPPTLSPTPARGRWVEK